MNDFIARKFIETYISCIGEKHKIFLLKTTETKQFLCNLFVATLNIS